MAAEYAGTIPHKSTGKIPLTPISITRVKFRAMDDGIKQRIQERLKALELSPRAASLRAGGSADLIRGLLRDKQRGFRGENLTKLAEVLGVSVNWLQTGEHEHIPSEDILPADSGSGDFDRMAASMVRKYKGKSIDAVPEIDARAGAGNGSVGEEVVAQLRGEAYIGHKVTAEWAFPSSFLRHELRTQPGAIIVLEVVGDSMSPTLESGDRVIIDTNYLRVTPDGIYVIDEGNGPMVKRLQLVRRSDPAEVRILSDNKNHEAYTLRLEDIRLIGRVSGRVTRM